MTAVTGARLGRSSWFRHLAARAVASDLTTFVVPEPRARSADCRRSSRSRRKAAAIIRPDAPAAHDSPHGAKVILPLTIMTGFMMYMMATGDLRPGGHVASEARINRRRRDYRLGGMFVIGSWCDKIDRFIRGQALGTQTVRRCVTRAVPPEHGRPSRMGLIHRGLMFAVGGAGAITVLILMLPLEVEVLL